MCQITAKMRSINLFFVCGRVVLEFFLRVKCGSLTYLYGTFIWRTKNKVFDELSRMIPAARLMQTLTSLLPI